MTKAEQVEAVLAGLTQCTACLEFCGRECRLGNFAWCEACLGEWVRTAYINISASEWQRRKAESARCRADLLEILTS